MIALLNLSIFVLSASFIKANYDFNFNKDSGNELTVCKKDLKDSIKLSKRYLRKIRRLKKQNEQLESQIEELESDGEWGSWSGWSGCRSSSFCGKGFTTRNRSCTPQGKYCEGDTLEAQECDSECPPGLNKSIKQGFTLLPVFTEGRSNVCSFCCINV